MVTNVLSGYESILSERDGTVLLLTLNRPEKLNAANNRLHEELSRVFVEADNDSESNVIVVTGAGRAFCVGGDVEEQKEGAERIRESQRVRNRSQAIIENLLTVEKPIISMVNGPALGFGAVLALTCDIAVAADDAIIADRHINVGLVAADGGTVILPLLIGVNRAKELLMTGRKLTGREAADMGLVNHAVPPAELRSFTMKLGHELGSLMPFSVRATKVAINRILRRQLLEQMDATTAWQAVAMPRDDRIEALNAFLERREPKFTGR